jgi:hypothetical protein
MTTTAPETPTLPNPEHGHTAYGVTVYALGEDGDLVVAFGHQDKQRFLAACNHYARIACGMASLTDDWSWGSKYLKITHTYGTFDPEPDDQDAEWALNLCDDKPGAVRVTKVTI